MLKNFITAVGVLHRCIVTFCSYKKHVSTGVRDERRNDSEIFRSEISEKFGKERMPFFGMIPTLFFAVRSIIRESLR